MTMKFAAALAFSLSFCTVHEAAAGPMAENPLSPVFSCQETADETERLKCFDREVQNLKLRQVAGEIQTVDMASIQLVEKETFGLSLPSLPSILRGHSDDKSGRESISEITASVESARIQNISKKVIIVLDNGQTWEQTDTTRVDPFAVRRAKEARIRRAALGSFMMTLDGSQPFRVKRVM